MLKNLETSFLILAGVTAITMICLVTFGPSDTASQAGLYTQQQLSDVSQ